MTIVQRPPGNVAWYALSAEKAARQVGVVPDRGLDIEEAERRLSEYGPNELPTEPAPSVWAVARGQLANPMNIMLLMVSGASFAIVQIATAVVVLALVMFNVVMSTNQEMKARASVDALAKLQVPHARVRRSGQVDQVESTTLVPGDVVLLEAGDVVPADGRIVSSATLEVQEAALTGESAPVAKDSQTLPDGDVALGDRTNLVFQNTQVTRGTATSVVTATGSANEMGRIAGMVTATRRSKSPLQRELDGMTTVFGTIAFAAVAIIAIFGLVRGQDTTTLVLLCVSTAIAAIPTGLPTFVQAMLSSGARRLAEAKAVVKSLSDVETLGGTTVINSDKTGTLTMNAMTATTMLADGNWFKIEGRGYRKTGAILGAAGEEPPDFRRLSLGLILCTDATVADDGSVIGDPTEAAFVVLAAKMGADAEQTRQAHPRRAEVPFDSAYKFMATFHDTPGWLTGGIITQPHFVTVKGAPDVVLARCGRALWHGQQVAIGAVREEILAANRQLSERGLRVLAFAAADLDGTEMAAAVADPIAAVTDLVFVALVGIMDPLRAEAKDAVRTALSAGVDVRMITGDHTVTARAIADQLGLGPGVITGTELQRISDPEVIERLPRLHVFGRVAPEDKLRLARLMQESGDVVAMTGDAVNDAAALKQADVGVAMGSGSEVSKQAAKIVLTDDNFATLVRAIDLGRDIYRRISTYVRMQLTILSAVLQLMVYATILNINGGVALFPLQLLFCKFFVVITVVIGFIVDVPDPGVMQRPPRKPGTKIVTRQEIIRWFVTGFVLAATALAVLEWGPGKASATHASVNMTMAFAVVSLSAVNIGLVMRRERQAPWASPVFPYLGWIILGWVLTWAAVELGMLQRLLDTTSLTGRQWVVVLALSLLTPAVVAVDRVIRLRPPAGRMVPQSAPWLARLSFVLILCAVAVVAVAAGLRSLVMLAVGLAAAVVSLMAAFWFLSHRGAARWLALTVFVAAPVAVIVVYALHSLLWVALAAAAGWLLAGVTARAALACDRGEWRMPEYPVSRPARHPFLIMNPKSGGGKVGRFDLRRKATDLGAEVFMLGGPEPVDVAEVARAAIARGADLLGVAGGDGTQALVAGVAAEHGIPFVVITAGTRNHFALDLGLDRDNPPACLGALSDPVELRADLGVVGGRIFVNNASFGAYAEVIEAPAYRDDKLRTTLDMLPDLLGGHRGPRLTAHAGGTQISAPQALLVANNPYGTGDVAGLGRRARLDGGVLGVVAVTVSSARQAADLIRNRHAAGLRVLTAREVTVSADRQRLPVGIDGEAVSLPVPVRCAVRPGALRVWVPRDRPGIPAPKPELNWVRLRHLAGWRHAAPPQVLKQEAA